MKALRAIFLVVALGGFNQTLRAAPELANAIQAVVRDSVITKLEVEYFSAPTIELLRREYRTQPAVLQTKALATLSESLDRFVERDLILNDFKTAGYNFPESIIEEAVQARIRAKYRDRVTLIKSLQEQGITYESFRQQIRDQIIVEALRAKNGGSGEIIISPHQIEVYYLAHTNAYQVEEEVKLRMIMLNIPSEADADQVRLQAGEILTKIKDGAAFSEMAGVYSQGAQRSQGGDWGWVERSVLRKELAETAFSLKAGELSAPIETPQAIYLMLVEDKRPARIKPLNSVRAEIERILITQESERLQKKYIDRLKKKTFVRFF